MQNHKKWIHALNKITFLNLREKVKQTLMLLLFIFFSSCSSDSISEHQSKPEKTNFIISKNSQLAIKVNPVSEKTRLVYRRYCTQCHGIGGNGDGVNAPYLVVPPRDHRKGDYLETRSDQHLFEAIKFGGLAVGRAPCMPAWENTFKDETIHSLVNYIRELCDCKAL